MYSMVTGWSILVGSSTAPASSISWTSALPREVTRMVTWVGLLLFISGMGGTTLTGPSHLPAKVLSSSKDFCASDCAKATVESAITAQQSSQRNDFIFHSPQVFLFRRPRQNS